MTDPNECLAQSNSLPFTGERMTPEGAAIETVWEHVYRYRFALPYVRGKDVLDVACGEGYGTAALAASGARSVIGVDVDPIACEHARRKYGRDRMEIHEGDAANLPLSDASVDAVVSFETVEHVTNPAKFIAECFRVLRPSGTLIISTPNVDVFNPDHDPDHNPYHCSEMSIAQFRALLADGFHSPIDHVQRCVTARAWHSRSLCSYPLPWLGRRGLSRLLRLSRPFRPNSEQEVRRDPIAVILESDEGFLGRLFNLYTVRPTARWSGARPTYYVIVATVKK